MSGSHDYDVIVVGTGYGGASAAESLARAGLKVAMLERGTWWGAFEGHRPLPETLPQIVAALSGLNLSGFGRNLSIPLSRRGLIEVSLHQGTIVVNSSAVGGNSVVSGAYLQRPAPQFFDALPPEVTAAELDPHYERIERALQVAPGPQDERKLARVDGSRRQGTVEARADASSDPLDKRRPGVQPPCTQLQPLHVQLQRRRQVGHGPDADPERRQGRGGGARSVRGGDDRAGSRRLRGSIP